MANTTLAPHAQIPIRAARYAVAISWDHVGAPIDVDLQALVVDNRGSIIDAVCYNNMKALKCMTHSGDEQTGERAGYDEVIWVGLSKMPAHVRMVIFVVAAHTGGYLREVRNGMIHLLEERSDNEVAKFAIENSTANVDAVCMMVRPEGGGGWAFHVVDEPAQDGRHFMDILEPTIGSLIRKEIRGAPRRQKVAFAMEKGSVFDLPDMKMLPSITAGLGWDVLGKGVDLDVSAVLFTGRGHLDTCFFGKLQACGLQHSGDNLTGAGDGDDEQIRCNLDKVPAETQQIFFVVNIYTRGVTFQKVQNAYCRVFDDTGNELARYELREGGRESCLIIARLFRESSERWGFQALGTFSRGSMWKDALPDLKKILSTPPRSLQLRGQSTMSLGGSPGLPETDLGPRVQDAGAAPGQCCHIQ